MLQEMGQRNKHKLNMEYKQDDLPTATPNKFHKVCKKLCTDGDSLKHEYRVLRKDNHNTKRPGGQIGSKRKFNSEKVAQQIRGKSSIIKPCKKLPRLNWF